MVADVYGKGIHPPAPKESGVEQAKNTSTIVRCCAHA
jgi:hypothetical protein